MALAHAHPVCTTYPVSFIIASGARQSCMTVKQRFYEQKSTRDECVVHALKFATEFNLSNVLCYASGTNVRCAMSCASDKGAFKTFLRENAKWNGFLPDDEARQFEEDVYAAWGGGAGAAADVGGAADDVASVAAMHRVDEKKEELIVVRSHAPLPKNIDVIVGKMPAFTFLTKRSERVCYAKAPIGTVSAGCMQTYSIASTLLYAQRLSEWTAETCSRVSE
jgi:hypothetical protein